MVKLCFPSPSWVAIDEYFGSKWAWRTFDFMPSFVSENRTHGLRVPKLIWWPLDHIAFSITVISRQLWHQSFVTLGGKLSLIIQGMDQPTLADPETMKDRRTLVVNYFTGHLRTHNSYVMKFIFCEVLNLINILTQVKTFCQALHLRLITSILHHYKLSFIYSLITAFNCSSLGPWRTCQDLKDVIYFATIWTSDSWKDWSLVLFQNCAGIVNRLNLHITCNSNKVFSA